MVRNNAWADFLLFCAGTVLVVGGTVGFLVAKRMTLEAYAEYGDYAATTASGFESTAVGLRLLWRAGL